MDPVTLATLIAAVAAPLLGYLAAARRFSGKINNTEATDLWAAATDIRDWSARRIAELESRIEALEADRERLYAELSRMTEANANARVEIARLEAQLDVASHGGTPAGSIRHDA